MRLLFVLSATMWSWLVGRAIVFGPNTKSLCWHPNMHASTWYRLTPNPYNIPHRYFPYIPLVFAVLSIPSLFIENDLIHIATVLRLVSEHAYIPMFVAHVHSERIITAWSLINAFSAGATAYACTLLHSAIATVSIPFVLLSAGLHVWFLIIHLQLLCIQPIIREEHAYEERQPRIV